MKNNAITWFALLKKKLPCFVSKILSFESTKLLILSASCNAKDCKRDGSLRCITTVCVGSSNEAYKVQKIYKNIQIILETLRSCSKQFF